MNFFTRHLVRPKMRLGVQTRLQNNINNVNNICTESTEPNHSDSLTRSRQSRGSYLVSAGLNSYFLRWEWTQPCTQTPPSLLKPSDAVRDTPGKTETVPAHRDPLFMSQSPPLWKSRWQRATLKWFEATLMWNWNQSKKTRTHWRM